MGTLRARPSSGLQYAVHRRPADLERFRDLRGPSPCAFIARTWAASIEAGRPLYTPAALAFAIPSSWRSRRRFVSNSANTPSMSRKHLPAAVLVSIGCSVAFNEAPRRAALVRKPARSEWPPKSAVATPESDSFLDRSCQAIRLKTYRRGLVDR
jgi:hypothetical protein